MSIAEQFWTIAPFPNGFLYSTFPLGNSPLPLWTTIPDFIRTVGTPFSVNIQQTYLTPTSGATVTLNGDLTGTGFSYNGTTTVLSYDGTTAGTPAAISFTAVFNSISTDSNTFNVQGLAAGVATAPRFGYVDISPSTGNTNPQYPQARAQKVARGDTVIMGFYAGIGTECYGPTGNSLKNYVDYIHSLNSACAVFPYILPDSMGSAAPVTGNKSYPDLYNAVNGPNAWLLYANWPGRSGPVANYDASYQYVSNSSSFAKTDPATGLKLEAFTARLFGNLIFNNIGSTAATDYSPGCAGVFHDNVFGDVLSTGDWQQNGSTLGPSSPTGSSALALNYRTQLGSFATQLRATAPGKLAIGNIARWNLNTPGGGTFYTGFSKSFNGGLIESMMGLSYSSDSFDSSGATAKAQYDAAMLNTTGEKVGIGAYWDTNGRGYMGNKLGLPAFQDAEYMACFAWQNDGEVWTANPTSSYTDVAYYAPQATFLNIFCVVGHTCQPEATPQLGKRYLGVRTSVPWNQLTNGVYATTYSDGTRTWVVFLNLGGNSSKSFVVSDFFPGYTKLQKLSGNQRASVNNGAQVTTINIGSRDSLIGYLVA